MLKQYIKRYAGGRQRRLFALPCLLAPIIFFFAADSLLEAEKRSNAGVEIRRITGKGYNAETGEFLFWAKHRQTWKKERKKERQLRSTVSFYDPKGKLFAHKYLDFQHDQDAPNFILKDYRDGYYEEIKWIGKNQFRFQLRRQKEGKLKTSEVASSPPTVIDGGFDNYIRDNFADLLRRSHEVSFALPYWRDFVTLDLRKTGERMFQSRKAVAMQLVVGNLLLRQFTKPIKVLYDKQKRQLLLYEGLSSINNDEGESYQTRIIYRHHAPTRL